jgi:putative transposase
LRESWTVLDYDDAEFIAYAVNDWCRSNSTGSLFIDPGSLWQNAWIESFNGRAAR